MRSSIFVIFTRNCHIQISVQPVIIPYFTSEIHANYTIFHAMTQERAMSWNNR